MPQKSNHDFKKKYPSVHVVTFVSMRITDILTENTCLVFRIQRHIDIEVGKEVDTIVVVDKWPQSLITHLAQKSNLMKFLSANSDLMHDK